MPNSPPTSMSIFAAETGVVMLIYLDQAFTDLQAQRAAEGRPFTHEDLHAAIMSGGGERVRPLMMTVAAIMAGLLPIMWNHGTGAEVMQRIAVPMIGGMVSATVLTLVVIPSIYAVVKGIGLPAARWDGDAGGRREHTAHSRPLEVHEGAK